ncbi:c-type cytochrome domain-containing protein [Blastopirellula marina]|uniref:Putative WD-repeat containing protein n=1 Tax=Blastopirellula marina DSM 3645 TaxID=314230 RepID=A3ZW90_9BACT|nr:c-type cytochrome domain-containing protein [Blastopirellula marina]EAQ79118.1 putative WD-repeat containing protein [Blastopirellula marina DSM 3645]
MRIFLLTTLLLCVASAATAAEPAVDYTRDIGPLLTKYCAGCHNPDDANAELILTTFDGLQTGGESGAILAPDQPEKSLLLAVLATDGEPKMPPEEEPQPTAAELALLRRWILAGATGPQADEAAPQMNIPQIAVRGDLQAGTSCIALSPRGDQMAIARYGKVELAAFPAHKTIHRLDFPGKVNQIAYSADGTLVAGAGGQVGVSGEVRIWDAATGRLKQSIRGHHDAIYSVAFSPDAQVLATGSYDKDVIVWDLQSGLPLNTLTGHNDAIYDLAFRNDSKVLATCSADRTVKLWDITTGERLETFGEATDETNAVCFSPAGNRVAAAGADNRIRVWQVSKSAAEGTNRLLFTKFAHDAPILDLALSPDGKLLVSAAEDRTVRFWRFADMELLGETPHQADWPVSLAVTQTEALVALARGDWRVEPITGIRGKLNDAAATIGLPYQPPPAIRSAEHVAWEKLPSADEVEPNNGVNQAGSLAWPQVIRGVLQDDGAGADVDLYRFAAEAGEQIIFETRAARDKSPADTCLEILDAAGEPVPHVLLRGVRDAEVTFRGINSSTIDCRTTNWEEMELNQFLYIQGEVVRLYRMPQGPDSGFNFYPGQGKRRPYFDTTAHAHALFEPCYIVEPYAPGSDLPDNGLPTFTLNYQNDDDSEGRGAGDSLLAFVAPHTGDYLVSVRDVRGFEGDDYKYQLIARRPLADYSAKLNGANPTINAGSGKEFTIQIERFDNFNGPVEVEITGLPPGFQATSPLVIEAGHIEATGVLSALPWAPAPTAENESISQVIARAMIDGQQVTKEVGSLGKIQLAERPKLAVFLSPQSSPDGPFGEPPPERTWKALRTDQFTTSDDHSELALLNDGSLLAIGANPGNDHYRLEIPLAAGETLHAIRLDVLGHASLPSGSPGRGADNGNFVLTGLKLSYQPAGKPSQPIAIASAAVDYAQAGFAAAGLIDDNPKTGWAIAEPKDGKFPVKRNGKDPAHYAVLEFAQPLATAQAGKLICELRHEGNAGHQLGHFRLAATVEPPIIPDYHFPAVQELTIVAGETITCQLRVDRNGFDDRIQFDVSNLPHGVIVDNIGLSGVLIPAGQLERTLHLTAAAWTPASQRTFQASTKVEGKQTSLPIRLRVVRPAAN